MNDEEQGDMPDKSGNSLTNKRKQARIDIDEDGMVALHFSKNDHPHRKVLFRVEGHFVYILNPGTGEEERAGTLVCPAPGVIIIVIP